MRSRSYQYHQSTHWTQPAHTSSFQPTHFSQSVFQRTAPSTAYPTPPPPIINHASSSLAGALGPNPVWSQATRAQAPPVVAQPQQQRSKVYQPQESQAFYEDFLERKARQMMPARQALQPAAPVQVVQPLAHTMTPPQPKLEPMAVSSPDPLAMCLDPKPRAIATAVTPQKRKPAVVIESPSIKRIQALKTSTSNSIMHQSPQLATPRQLQTAPLTPSSRSSDVFTTPGTLSEVTPTNKRVVHKAYVEVPRSPWVTPSSSRKPLHQSGKPGETPDLGGYGSEEDGPASPTKRYATDSVKSSARRTGDRDDRGQSNFRSSLNSSHFF